MGIIGKYAIIDGGYTEENKHSNKVYILDLEKNQFPTVIAQAGLKLVYHTIISTEEVNKSVNNFLKV